MAERLGMTFEELSERMTAEELLEWIQYDRIHLAPERVDTALLCVTMARLVGNKNARLEHFLPERLKADRPADPDIAERIKAWAVARVAAQQSRVVPFA